MEMPPKFLPGFLARAFHYTNPYFPNSFHLSLNPKKMDR
jgi:hypothetical protein